MKSNISINSNGKVFNMNEIITVSLISICKGKSALWMWFRVNLVSVVRDEARIREGFFHFINLYFDFILIILIMIKLSVNLY